ncbi:hypothetical protein T03_500 [Trichinella britovi]|uniref:Uncharacterized protein n=1 Tax=Trichinella britovi TaxID=45882 RepID=A0A0V1DAF3_TRIBR|nr:hypothetical protein T03_500 [Trichinella britovi]
MMLLVLVFECQQPITTTRIMCTSGNGDCVQLAPPTGRWSGLRTGLASQLPAGGLHPVASVFIFDWAETSSSSLILFRRFS